MSNLRLIVVLFVDGLDRLRLTSMKWLSRRHEQQARCVCFGELDLHTSAQKGSINPHSLLLRFQRHASTTAGIEAALQSRAADKQGYRSGGFIHRGSIIKHVRLVAFKSLRMEIKTKNKINRLPEGTRTARSCSRWLPIFSCGRSL